MSLRCPVLIRRSGNNGTALLAAILDSHPEIACGGEMSSFNKRSVERCPRDRLPSRAMPGLFSVLPKARHPRQRRYRLRDYVETCRHCSAQFGSNARSALYLLTTGTMNSSVFLRNVQRHQASSNRALLHARKENPGQ